MDEKFTRHLLTKTHSIGVHTLRLLLLTLQLEIELLLALHYRKNIRRQSGRGEISRWGVHALTSLQMDAIPVVRWVSESVSNAKVKKKYRPISISTGDAKAKCTREVKPEPLPEFSGDGCDRHCG